MMSWPGLIVCDKKNKRAKFTEIDGDNRRPYLPKEILQNIVIRLSARDLAKWSCVSKYWYKSILHDSKFAFSHFDHNKNKLNLVFNLLNVWIWPRLYKCYFFNIQEEEEEEEENDNGLLLLNYRLLLHTSMRTSEELVGYYNGLVCTRKLDSYPSGAFGQFFILNPTRSEMLSFNFAIPTSCRHLCNGFCFDSSSQQYKVVFIYVTTSKITGGQKFLCVVRALGVSNSACRKSVTSTAQIPGSSSPCRMVKSCSRTSRRSATLCGGDLLWRISMINDDNNEIDMLLSFDIHSKKIRFISLPTECSLTGTTTTTTNEHQSLVIDHHLLEFKGYPCVARSEKIMTHRNGHHRHHGHRRHTRRGHRSSRFCCCGFKVHMFLLKDKVNQVWIKEETFDLQIKEEQGLLPTPFCCYFDTNTTAALPTRILSFSDQLLLYWSDGEYLLLYNLQMKCLKVVKCIGRRTIDIDIFKSKLRRGVSLGRTAGDEDYIDFPFMDYQLHAQAENILSLKSFVSDGETEKFYNPRPGVLNSV